MNEGSQDAPVLAGLSTEEARARLAAEGLNELPRSQTRQLARIVIDVVSEPMFALLLGAGVLYMVLGDLADALILAGFAATSVVITIVQESRSERILETLRDLTSPRALVVRDGEQTRIPGHDVVRGDTIILTEGDRIPADAELVSAVDLEVDESLLTGESLPVRKHEGKQLQEQRTNALYSGTLVVRGRGKATVTATGIHSEIGKIGTALEGIGVETAPLRAQTARLVRAMAIAGISLAAAYILMFGLLRDAWLEALLGGIALTMSMLPEEFPLVLSVFMVMGAWRISQARVLTRRATAIETLGAATVLCTDKTGTLTQNKMDVAAVWTCEDIDLPPLKWSSLRYDFAMKEDDNGEEATHGRRDYCEAAAG